ncbi:MAG: nitroreductase family protein [Spirochaetales bacterium]|nr:nitroreductase family protein [Spirochaetales bacterium]
MNDIITEITTRRARRGFLDKPVERGTLLRLARAASLAPSCANNQPWRLLYFTEPGALERARAALTPGNYWAKRAPALLLIFTRLADDCRRDEGRDYALFDCGLAAQNFMLQATAEGLIAHSMAGFDAAALKRDFELPEDSIPLVMIAVGHPGDGSGLTEKHLRDEHAPQTRKPVGEVVFWNSL